MESNHGLKGHGLGVNGFGLEPDIPFYEFLTDINLRRISGDSLLGGVAMQCVV